MDVKMEKKYAAKLLPYTPSPEVALQFACWMVEHKIEVRVAGDRKSKLGDYRSPWRGSPHRISINGTLNPYAFTITFIHEIAHLYTWLQHRGRVHAHGQEWKDNFKKVMKPFLQKGRVFPEDIRGPLLAYMRDPAAGTCRDPELYKALRSYDPVEEQGYVFLSDLPSGTWFHGKDGRIFRKMRLLRKNYRCEEYKTGKLFNIVPHFLAKPLEEAPTDHNPQIARHSRKRRPERRESMGFGCVAEIPDGSFFEDAKGRVYKKIGKMRKNYRCIEMPSGREFSITGNFPAKLLKK